MKKYLSTNIFLLQSGEGDNKGFGYVQGFALLPDYDIKIKIQIKDEKFESISEIDNTKTLVLDKFEIESIGNASQFVSNSLSTLISLSKRNLLKDECFIEGTENSMNQ